jgi:hypothetical protein
MEKSEQRFALKFLNLKGLGSMMIRSELIAVLGAVAYSLLQIKNWHARFRVSEVSWKDQSKLGHPPLVLGRLSAIS